MANKLTTLYLYLGRRDKTGIRLLAILKGEETLATRIDDINGLGLPSSWTSQLSNIVYENRMLWELWLESADSWDSLRSTLKTRGYTNVPIKGTPEYEPAITSTPAVNLNSLPKKSLMIRKGF